MPAKILFVDDEPDQVKLMQRMFRRKIRNGEISLLFAGDGEEALAVLKDEPDIDIVVSDINMPRMDGLTLLEQLGQLDSPMKAIIVSAYGDMKNIRIAMNKGAFDFVTKPVEFEDLETTIHKSLAALEELRNARRELKEAEHARTNLARFFSPNIAYQLINHPDELEVGGERRDLTFLFTDLADFTPLVESSEPDLIVSLLNDYLGEMTNLVFDHGGTIDKIVGDAIHSIFGAPLSQPDHARRAVQCAIEMDEFAQSFSEAKQAEGIALGMTRIGINSGPAIVGNFGGESFFDYTAHGDAINTAARIEAANKQLGTRICVSESCVSRIREFHGRPIGEVSLKGKEIPVLLYEPYSDQRSSDPLHLAYLEAYQLLENSDTAEALKAFEALDQRQPGDPVVGLHIGRIRAGQSGITIQ
jgi:adenylate cyclase